MEMIPSYNAVGPVVFDGMGYSTSKWFRQFRNCLAALVKTVQRTRDWFSLNVNSLAPVCEMVQQKKKRSCQRTNRLPTSVQAAQHSFTWARVMSNIRKLIGAIRHPTSDMRLVKIRHPTFKNPTSDIRLVKIRHPTCKNPTSDLLKSDIRLVKIRHPTC